MSAIIGTRIYLVGLVFFAFSWLIADHHAPWLAFHSEALAVAGGAVLIAAMLTMADEERLPAPRVLIFLVLVACIPWVQWAAGLYVYAGDAAVGTFYVLALAGAVLHGFLAARKSATFFLQAFVACLWLCAMLSTFIGIKQWLGVESDFDLFLSQSNIGARIAANIGQSNHLASLLLLGTVGCAFAYENKKIGAWVFALNACCMGMGTLLTQSRTGILSSVAVAAFFLWKRPNLKSRISGKAVCAWIAVLLAGSACVSRMGELLLLGEMRGVAESAPISQRWKMWQQITSAVLESPWVGYGWNQTTAAYAAGAQNFPSFVNYSYAHDIFLDIFAWNGVVLGGVLSCLLLAWFFDRMRKINRLNEVYAMACLLPIAVHSLLEFPFAYAYFLLVAGTMVGVIEAGLTNTHRLSLRRGRTMAALLAFSLLGSIVVRDYFSIEQRFGELRLKAARIGNLKMDTSAPDVVVLNQMAALVRSMAMEIKPGMPSQEMDSLRDTAQRFSYAGPRLQYAAALYLNADAAGASRQLRIIKNMFGGEYYAVCKEEMMAYEKMHPSLPKMEFP